MAKAVPHSTRPRTPSRRAAASLSAFLCAAAAAGAQPAAVQVSRSGQGAYEASMAPHGGGFAVAWHDTRHGFPEIYARLVDASGRPVAGEHRLTTNADRSYEPSIAAAGARDLVVAWYDVAADGSWSRARIGAWTTAGGWRWTRTLSHPRRRGRVPVVAVHADRIQCVWLEETRGASRASVAADRDRGEVESDVAGNAGVDAAVWAQQLRLDGAPLGPPRRVAVASRETWNLNLEMDADGVAWIVFDARVGTRAHELFLAQVEGGSATVRRLSADDGVPSVYPDVAFGAGRAALTWFDERDGNADVHLAVVDPHRLPPAIGEAALRVTDTLGASIGAYVAWNGARFGLAWSDEIEPGRSHEVHFQQFTAGGAPAGGPRRLTDNPTASLIPAIRAAGSRFALAWNEDVVEARGDHLGGGRSEVVFALAP